MNMHILLEDTVNAVDAVTYWATEDAAVIFGQFFTTRCSVIPSSATLILTAILKPVKNSKLLNTACICNSCNPFLSNLMQPVLGVYCK